MEVNQKMDRGTCADVMHGSITFVEIHLGHTLQFLKIQKFPECDASCCIWGLWMLHKHRYGRTCMDII